MDSVRYLRGALASILVLLPALALPFGGAEAQERQVVFNQISVAGGEANLRVEFDDGAELEIAFRDGEVRVDGAVLGEYEPGGELEASWRALLGRAIAMDNGVLGAELRGWTPPSGLSGASADVARALTARLGTAFAAPSADPDRPLTLDTQVDGSAIVAALLRSQDRLRELAAAVRDMPMEGLRVHVGESVRIPAGEVIDGSLLTLDSRVDLDGTVEGDVLLLGGSLTLGDDARIGGDLRWSDAEIGGDRGVVSGRIREIRPVSALPEADLRDEIRREVEAATRAATATAATRAGRSRSSGAGRFIRNVVGGIGGLVQTVMTFAILLGAGLAILYFFPRHFETVARTAREAPGRSALVGVATLVLSLPIWVLGILILTVSIIGIPVMLLWLPAFPLALALAAILGYLAMAGNVGRWVHGRELGYMNDLDVSRPAMQLGIGLMVLLSGYALAHVFQMFGGILTPFRVMAGAAAWVLGTMAMIVGLGAVVLSRAGRERGLVGPEWTETGDEEGPTGGAAR